MEPIRLIRNHDELCGTCYFEFLPGTYQDRCWNEGSVFLAEEVFAYFECIIARNEPRFDHYSFIGIHKPTWERICADIERLISTLDSANQLSDLEGQIRFPFRDLANEFASNFEINSNALAGVSRELVAWVKDQLMREECVSVLGM